MSKSGDAVKPFEKFVRIMLVVGFIANVVAVILFHFGIIRFSHKRSAVHVVMPAPETIDPTRVQPSPIGSDQAHS